jgi:hypothetical protein
MPTTASRPIGRTTRIAFCALLLVAATLPAAAGASTQPIQTGYYADLIGVPSSAVTFHLRAHNTIPDLVVDCYPADTQLINGTAAGAIFVRLPAIKLTGDHFSFNGTARVTLNTGTAKVATTKLRISAHHVNGPVRHYTFEGEAHTETRAWVGTVSSPACKTLGAHGTFKLYGPVSGE